MVVAGSCYRLYGPIHTKRVYHTVTAYTPNHACRRAFFTSISTAVPASELSVAHSALTHLLALITFSIYHTLPTISNAQTYTHIPTTPPPSPGIRRIAGGGRAGRAATPRHPRQRRHLSPHPGRPHNPQVKARRPRRDDDERILRCAGTEEGHAAAHSTFQQHIKPLTDFRGGVRRRERAETR